MPFSRVKLPRGAHATQHRKRITLPIFDTAPEASLGQLLCASSQEASWKSICHRLSQSFHLSGAVLLHYSGFSAMRSSELWIASPQALAKANPTHRAACPATEASAKNNARAAITWTSRQASQFPSLFKILPITQRFVCHATETFGNVAGFGESDFCRKISARSAPLGEIV